jgi:hypothetical protein
MTDGIGRDDAVADRLQRDLRALLLAEQRLLVELALGDVELDADQPQQPAARVERALARLTDPAPFAAAMAHAVDALEQRRLAGDVVAQQRLHAGHVVRMHELRQSGDTSIVGRIAEHRLPARREIHLFVSTSKSHRPSFALSRDSSVRSSQRRDLVLEAERSRPVA